MADQEEAPSSWVWFGIAPSITAIWGVKQGKTFLSIILSNKLKKKKKKNRNGKQHFHAGIYKATVSVNIDFYFLTYKLCTNASKTSFSSDS